MAEAETQSSNRCKALTASGERCSREAGPDGFCHQHDESDSIADSAKDEVDDTEESSGDTESDSDSESNEDTDVSETDTTDPSDVDAASIDEEAIDAEIDTENIEAVLTVRRTIESTASELIGRPFDGVTEIEPTEAGWRGVVEVIERSSIPDTQDILGRYEIDMTDDGVIEGYQRLDRYRRDDTSDRA